MHEALDYRMTRVPFDTTASTFLLSVQLHYHFQRVSGKHHQTAAKLASCLCVGLFVFIYLCITSTASLVTKP